ncbi:MAG: serine hydrolase [Deltaproteobacteria bacterium]|nr:serine hydrolase [Deltaproteobacteria bacterium]
MKRSQVQRKLGRVDRALDKAIANAEIPGAVVVASRRWGDEVLEHVSVRGSAALRPERVPMARETIFDLASLTKVMATTAALMHLVHEGAVSLDDPASKHLPHFGERGKDGVTVRHLLTHSSGLKPWRAFHELMLEKERKTGVRLLGTPAARDFVLDRIHRSSLVHEPGEAAVYGDLDFIVLGALVEAVVRQPLDTYCADRIFRPLGLAHTFFVRAGEGEAVPPDAVRQRFAATEACPWRGRVVWGEVHDPNASAMGGVAGHAGLFSTADDVHRFATALLDCWHGRSDVFAADTVRAFFTRQSLPKDSDWAIGWDTPTPGASSSGRHFSEDSVGHLGFSGTSVWIDLRKQAIVVMLTNRIHPIARRSQFKLRPLVHDLVMEAFEAA